MNKAELAQNLKECLGYVDECAYAKNNDELQKALRKLNFTLQSAYDFFSVPQNVRNAGAKRKVNPLTVVKLKRAGKSYRKIAEELGISHGIAHKLYHENSHLSDDFIEEHLKAFDY